MKKVCSIIVVTTALALSSSAVLPTAAYSYKSSVVETFDSMGTTGTNAPKLNGQSLWSVEPSAGGSDVAQRLLVSANSNGRTTAGFNAGAVGNTNRSLAVGRTSGANFTTKFINDTASKLTEIELYYDLECPWVSKGGGTVSATLSVQISTNGTVFVPLGTNYNAAVSNTTTTTFDSWLTDAQMDAQKLSKRNVGGIIPVPAALGSIQTGQMFYIRWVTDTQNASDKVTYGIDNLRTFTDSDGDGLSNAKELSLGTNPLKADTDGDGLPDGWEVRYTLSPTNAVGVNGASGDPDGDGLTNLQEYLNGTNPQLADSDADGMPDGWEVANGLSPLVNDAAADADSDGLTNLQEYKNGTNPKLADTDGDGTPDGDEIAYGTNPLDSASLFAVELKSSSAPAPSTLENNTVDWPAADGKYFTLMFSTSITGTFTPVTGCIRLTGKKGQRLSCIHSTEGELGFYKVLVEKN